MNLLAEGFIYLLAAVIFVPLANRLGLGSVLGYLIAGMVIGPALGIVGSETIEIQAFAEFGVVMMLFLVGLELKPAMLWQMRYRLMTLGGGQVIGSALLIMAAGMALGWPWQSALAVGMSLSMSSTAIALQTLGEKRWLKTPGGQADFEVLLAQDIAVIPILAIIPMLTIASLAGGGAGTESETLISGLPGWLQFIITFAVVGAIVVGGRTIVRPVFRFIAEARLREVFTAAALLLVIGTALLMNLVGLSAALGTFLAGVVLSDSEYRHELESDIDPFKGLLLGLFFITVGAGVDFELLGSAPLTMIGLTLGVMALKFAVLWSLAKAAKLKKPDDWLFALSICQAGEFAFVMLNYSLANGAIDPEISRTMTLVVALSMLLTPLLFMFHEKIVLGRLDKREKRDPDEVTEQGTVVVAGVGRFGQVVCRFLKHLGYKVVVLDQNPDLVALMRKIGLEAFYGDASRPDLLQAAGIADAKLFVAAISDPVRQIDLVKYVRERYPNCIVVARAADRSHLYELRAAGAHHVVREMFDGSLSAAEQAATAMGMHPRRAYQLARAFRYHDVAALDELQALYLDDGRSEKYLDVVRKRGQLIEDVMRDDRVDRHDQTQRSWAPPTYNKDGEVS